MTAIRENGATSGDGVLATYTYDNLGARTALTRGNGVVTSYSHDALGRLPPSRGKGGEGRASRFVHLEWRLAPRLRQPPCVPSRTLEHLRQWTSAPTPIRSIRAPPSW
jgi:hypothetical protein